MSRLTKLPERETDIQIRDEVRLKTDAEDGEIGAVKGIYLDKRLQEWMVKTEHGVASESHLEKVNNE